MQIVFDNRADKPVWKCNVCDKQDVWSNRWKGIEFCIGVGYRGEDRYFCTCSNECRKKDKEEKLFEQYRKKLHDNWWILNEELVEDFENEFKHIFDKKNGGQNGK
jgi:hypothetical protein